MKVCVFMLVCYATVCFSVPLEKIEADQNDLDDYEGLKLLIMYRVNTKVILPYY